MGITKGDVPMIWKSEIEIETENEPLRLTYFVSAPIKTPLLSAPCFGIGVSLGEETAKCTAFSPDKAEAIRVCRMLCKMQVTPVSFYEIMDDYLAAHP